MRAFLLDTWLVRRAVNSPRCSFLEIHVYTRPDMEPIILFDREGELRHLGDETLQRHMRL